MELDSGFKDRLKWAMTHKQTNQSELAREIATRTQGTCSPQAVQQWCSGATLNPRRAHLRAGAEFMGVRYEWLAYGRGPMREIDTPQAPAKNNNTAASAETALRSHEWENALLAALPNGARNHWQQRFQHPAGSAQMRVSWVSDRLLAEVGLYKHSGNLIHNARQLLWHLAVAREVVPPVPGRRTLLLLAPLDDWTEVPERHINALRAEARAAGIELIHASTPEQAASVLLGEEAAAAVPEADDLGLDVSPVL